VILRNGISQEVADIPGTVGTVVESLFPPLTFPPGRAFFFQPGIEKRVRGVGR